ncbi:hypothetical protein LTR08_000022 [Meristemomyces frigidus]|nr:hypothetical protein LTR08_000022 [Meristemomyces frigidus]
MADITPAFSVCLQAKGAPPVVKKEFNLDRINSFLHEAYSINARITDLTTELRAIRPAYLSAAPPPRRRQLASSTDTPDRARPLTDKDRDAIDAQSKQLLRQLNAKITQLKQVEDVRNQAADSIALRKRAQGGLGALGRWAAGGAITAKSPEEELAHEERKAVATCRESVVIYLQQRLEAAGRAQGDMMEVRLGREVEKSKSVLYKSRLEAGGIPYAQDDSTTTTTSTKGRNRQSANYTTAHEQDNNNSSSTTEAQLTQEQQQLFATENSALLTHYNTSLDALATAERSILDISELQSTLTANIQVQHEQIGQLVQDSYQTTENLGKGNKELKRASERRSTARMVCWATVGFCSGLVVWDLVF